MMNMMGTDGMNCFANGGGWMMMGGMLLFWALLTALLVMGIMKFRKRNQPKQQTNNPFEILKIRLANGEITEEEYTHLIEKVK